MRNCFKESSKKLRKRNIQTNFLSETEMPGTKVNIDPLQIICHRYYFASKFVSGKEMLEVGCGPGIGLGYLSKNAKWVVGGDITKNNLRCAQKHYVAKVELVSMDAHKQALGLKHFYLPTTEQISNEVLSLPMYPELSDERVDFVVEAVHNFYLARQKEGHK